MILKRIYTATSKRVGNRSSFCIMLFVLLWKTTSVFAQSKTDSLEQLLAGKKQTENRVIILQALFDETLEINAKKAGEYLVLLEEEISARGNEADFLNYHIDNSQYLRVTSQFEEAVSAANMALNLANKHKDSLEFKAKIYNLLGTIADDNSKIEEAIKYQLISLRYAEKFGDQELLAAILANIGRAYLYLSEFDVAKKYYMRAIAIKEENNQSDVFLSIYYSSLSNCYDAEEKYDSSLIYLNKSIALSEDIGNFINVITTFNNKAYTLFLMDNLLEAEKTIKLALSIADTLNVDAESMYAYSTYAEILFSQNSMKEANEMLKKSIALAKNHHDLYLEKFNLELMYNIALSRKDHEQALDYYIQKSIVEDSMYNIQSRKEIEKLSLEYETEKKNKAIELLNKENEISAIELQRSNQMLIAFVALAVFAVVVIFLLKSQYQNKQRTNALRKESMEQDFEKKLAEAEIQALKAQMNPHFLFNCLNSINSFIIKNDQEKASNYLLKFSKLIRRVLSNSNSSKVSLANELEALRLYIEIEALRFSKDFSFEIDVDAEVEEEYIEIPPLIIQPYVENSIWHGLMHKNEGSRKLSIGLKRQNGALICEIEDNGIGREAAMNLKSKSAVKTKSFGMSITKKRLKYINQKFEAETDIEVVDLRNQEGKGVGTRVIIKIGLN